MGQCWAWRDCVLWTPGETGAVMSTTGAVVSTTLTRHLQHHAEHHQRQPERPDHHDGGEAGGCHQGQAAALPGGPASGLHLG